jgi:hypothetical protein
MFDRGNDRPVFPRDTHSETERCADSKQDVAPIAHFTFTFTVFVVSLPGMSITFTTGA